jgi:hypothetical protein
MLSVHSVWGTSRVDWTNEKEGSATARVEIE